MEKNIKYGLSVMGVAIAALTVSNIVLFKKVGTLQENSVNSSEIASVKDKLIGFEETLSSQKPLELTRDQFNQYLMENPEGIVKSLGKFRFEQEQLAQKKKNEQMSNLTGAIYNDVNDPFFGNPTGKKVIVEFADYNCGYCKRLAPVLEEFVKIDPEAKVIIKEYPIFTDKPSSAYSALMGTALFYYDKSLYEKYHSIIMHQHPLTVEFVDETLVSLNASKLKLKPFLDKAKKQVESTRGLGAKLEVSGTPTLFVNGQRTHGGHSAQELIQMFN
jgi:protein-disulfide isomerase